jgi:hypothetical protein
MKKLFICMLIVVMFLISVCGCNAKTEGVSEPQVEKSFYVESIDEFNHLRDALSSKDEKDFDNYWAKYQPYFIKKDKKELNNFVELVESIPYASGITCDIGRISYSKGTSEGTGKPYEGLYIVIYLPGGDWMRYEYFLQNGDDVLESRKKSASKLFEGDNAVFSKDKKMNILTERRAPHPSGTGEMIYWGATLDGMVTAIVYYSTKPGSISASELFCEASIINFGTAIEE